MWYMRQKEEFGEDRSQGIRFYDNTQTCDYLPHWHMSYEVIMVIAENLTVIVENERYLLHPGDIMVIPSGSGSMRPAPSPPASSTKSTHPRPVNAITSSLTASACSLSTVCWR